MGSPPTAIVAILGDRVTLYYSLLSASTVMSCRTVF